ncbi:MAG: type II toxin-antitoxin system RelE/ParE family toxin [Pseudomonadota bacterium]
MAFFRIAPTAKQDLGRIYDYGARQFGIAQADRYLAGLRTQFEKIAGMPRIYPQDDIRENYRRCVYRSDVIYYREIEGGIEIMAVLGQQDRDQWL